MSDLFQEQRAAWLVLGTFLFSLIGGSMTITAWERLEAARFNETAGMAAPFAEARDLPQIEPAGMAAEAYLVKTFSGRVIASRNADKSYPMASLTKIMTGLLLREWGEDVSVWITPRTKEVSPKHSTVPVGEILSADAAFTLLLAESDNDIAEAIADAVGTMVDGRAADPRAAFINAMNKKAAALGMGASHFDNPSGLDSYSQHASAADLFRLSEYATAKFGDFWDVTVDPPDRVQSLSGKKYAVRPSNLLKDEGLAGVKTGLSENAKGALLLRYRTPYFPEDLIIVILRSDDRFGDGERLMAAVRRAFRDLSK